MLHLCDRATMAHALTLDLDPQLRRLLAERILTLSEDLIDWTEYLIVQPGDTEDDIIKHLGFSPLIEPIDQTRFGEPGFYPYFDWLADHDGWFEMIITTGSTFAYILFIADAEGVPSELRELCSQYSGA